MEKTKAEFLRSKTQNEDLCFGERKFGGQRSKIGEREEGETGGVRARVET